MVEVLLQNGAEVNAPREVIFDLWRDLINRNAHHNVRNEIHSVSMALAMTDRIEPMIHG